MKIVIFWSMLIFVSLLTACGGDDGNGSDSGNDEMSFDPWKDIGEATLDESAITEQVRVLEFGDGMTISYDGSDEEGEERVCRREGREGVFYEVCVSLEDDPYFVALEKDTLVWHPLMFDRFATNLDCYTQVEGEEKEWADCESEVFPKIGGEDFLCKAGLVNGDKALKCSDEWAVVVNGGDNNTKTICRVHLSQGSGRCLGARKAGVKDDKELILPMQPTFWSGYQSTHGNSRQFLEGEEAVPLPIQDLPEGAKLSYFSTDTGVCMVNNNRYGEDLGKVSISMRVRAPAECKIVLVSEAEGFADRVFTARLPILKASEVRWEAYQRVDNYFFVGETLTAEVPVLVAPTDMSIRYTSLDESVCTVNKDSGAVVAVAPGECTIRLIAREKRLSGFDHRALLSRERLEGVFCGHSVERL